MKKGLDYLDEYDSDIAADYLKNIIDKKDTGLSETSETYASNIDSLARSVHLNVWEQLPSTKQVKCKLIPLLKKAIDSIDENDPAEIKKHSPKVIKNNARYSEYAMHVKACISFRIKNLKRYCLGLNPDIESCIKEVEKEGKYKFID